VFFYDAVRALPVARLFPAMHGSGTAAAAVAAAASAGAGAVPLPPLAPRLEFTMDFVKGVPLTTMFRASLLAEYHLAAAVAALREMHACDGVALTLPLPALRASYGDKLRARVADASVYGSRADAPAARRDVEASLRAYTGGVLAAVAHVVHGDAWFANILLTPTNELRFLDMRGLVGDALTLNGDAACDWAKLLQSLLGFDEVVFGFPRAPRAYRADLVRAFARLVRAAGARTSDVLDVCICLVAGSLHAYEDAHVQDALWALATSALWPQPGSEMAELVAILREE
jgi:aminoglycoside phosphotransferase (APT) family kinase protein